MIQYLNFEENMPHEPGILPLVPPFLQEARVRTGQIGFCRSSSDPVPKKKVAREMMMVIMIMTMMTMMVMITWVSLMISCLSLSTSSGPAILTKVSAQLQKASSWSVELISQDIHLQQWWNPNILTTRRSVSQAALAISVVSTHLQSQVRDFTWTSSRHNHNHNQPVTWNTIDRPPPHSLTHISQPVPPLTPKPQLQRPQWRPTCCQPQAGEP